MASAPRSGDGDDDRHGASTDGRRDHAIILRACYVPPFSRLMNLTGASQFNQARIEWAIRLRYSPMPNLSMDWVAAKLNAFRIGELRGEGKIWDGVMERCREV